MFQFYLQSGFRELADGLHSSQFPMTVFTDIYWRNANIVVAGLSLMEQMHMLTVRLKQTGYRNM